MHKGEQKLATLPQVATTRWIAISGSIRQTFTAVHLIAYKLRNIETTKHDLCFQNRQI